MGRAESRRIRPRGIGALRASWKGREGAGVGRAQDVLCSRPGEQHGGAVPGRGAWGTCCEGAGEGAVGVAWPVRLRRGGGGRGRVVQTGRKGWMETSGELNDRAGRAP